MTALVTEVKDTGKDLEDSWPEVSFFNRNKNNAILTPEEENQLSKLSLKSTEKSDLYYDMSGKKYLYIFNHFKFKPRKKGTPTDRNGTGKDVKRLRATFEALGFHVKDYHDLNHETIIDTIHEIILLDHKHTSCVAVAVLTHGDYGGVLEAADKPYSINEIHDKFVYAHNPHLANKPKLFFIQACRGEKLDEGKLVTDGSGDDGDYFLLPSHVDILTLYSTSPDYVSWREGNGSWLIQSLCNVIERHRELDIHQIITLVNAEVARRKSYNTKKALNNKMQVPETHYTLTKFFKF